MEQPHISMYDSTVSLGGTQQFAVGNKMQPLWDGGSQIGPWLLCDLA